MKQSRAAGSVVTPGATLVITVAKEPEKVEPEPEPQTDENGESTNTGE